MYLKKNTYLFFLKFKIMKNFKTILLILILFVSSISFSNAFEGQEYVDNVEFWDDGSIVTDWAVVEDNNVVGWDAQVTDEKTTAWDVVVNEGAPTDVVPISASANQSTTLNSSSELNITNEKGVIEVTQLPTTWPETILLLIISFFIVSFIFFKNKSVKV